MSQPEPPPRSHEAEEDPTPTTVVTGADRAAGAIVVALLTQRGHHVIGVDTPRSAPWGPSATGTTTPPAITAWAACPPSPAWSRSTTPTW